MRASSTLRVAVDSIESLNLGSVRLKTSSAFFNVGFGVGGGTAALQRGCGRGDDAEHSRTQKLTSPDGCFLPIAHQKNLIGQLTSRSHDPNGDALKQRSRKRRIG